MTDVLSLTTPIDLSEPDVTNYRVSSLLLDWDGEHIVVSLRDNEGRRVRCAYSGATATALMVSLNTADLSVQSLHARILAQLSTDGKLGAGTVQTI